MYLGIDFLISCNLKPYVVEVNMGLPGGAQEYDLAHRVCFGRPSYIFKKIEETSLKVYGIGFKDYIHSLPFIGSLKPFKIWMDGKGPLPTLLHPGLKLEDKWIQYQLIKLIAPVPETMIFDPKNLVEAEAFLKRKGRVVLKRRLGRGGRGFKVVAEPISLFKLDSEGHPCILQEYVESKIDDYVFSIRAIAFGGEFMCMYGNLSTRPHSNHGFLTYVGEGDHFGLADRKFKSESFNQKSWEAEIWFGQNEPPYLRHNLYEDEVAKTTLCLPEPIQRMIRKLSVDIERLYEGLDLSSLPKACFEIG
jgi:hypothetical protein